MKYITDKIGKLLPTVIVTVLAVICFSCKEYEMFDKEQYKNVFGLLSDDEYNIFAVEHDLEQAESTGYIAASMGGTNLTGEDISITLKQDISSFNNYNEINFGTTTGKFAKLLPESHYGISSYTFTINKGERSGLMPISIRPEGLSPDSIYMIPLKIDGFSAYEANAEKSNVLYRVLIKNKYAAQKSLTSYGFTGYRDGQVVMGVKVMHPLTKNRVRIMAGQLAFEASPAVIDANAIVLEVQDDNSVKILPWKTGGIAVEQIDGDPQFPNVFKVENDGFNDYNTFLLYYKYGSGTEMKEELRLQVKKQQ